MREEKPCLTRYDEEHSVRYLCIIVFSVDNVSNSDVDESDFQMRDENETVEEINKQEQEENDPADFEKVGFW